jgi:hypothetical protein
MSWLSNATALPGSGTTRGFLDQAGQESAQYRPQMFDFLSGLLQNPNTPAMQGQMQGIESAGQRDMMRALSGLGSNMATRGLTNSSFGTRAGVNLSEQYMDSLARARAAQYQQRQQQQMQALQMMSQMTASPLQIGQGYSQLVSQPYMQLLGQAGMAAGNAWGTG